MGKRHRNYRNRILKIGAFITVAFVAVFVLLQLQAKNMVADFLQRKIPSHIKLNYESLEVSLLSGNIHFSDISMQLLDRDSTLVHTDITAENLNIEGIGYWQFFIKNTIKADEVSLKSPYVTHFASRVLPKDQNEPEGLVNLLKDIVIGKIGLTNGSFDLTKKQNDSFRTKARNINFTLLNGRTGPDIIVKKIPLEYGDYEFEAAQIFVDLGDYETATADTLLITKTDVLVKNTRLTSKYSKAALSRAIAKEHDHIDLHIPEFRLKGIKLGFESNRFFFFSQYGEIDNPDLTVYRDKMVSDDFSSKRMYSAMLREIPIHIAIDSLNMKEGKVRYEENSTYETKAGSLYFDALDGTMYNINNGYPEGEKTLANLKGNLMGTAPISLEYRFDMNRKDDAFTLKATLFSLDGERVNSFLRPNLNTQITGTINELYLTASGNNLKARGDMKMKYNDLKFEILKKDRLHINKLLSAIGNLFVNDGSDTDAAGYRYGTIDVERDQSKSFFNFIWKITQDGLLSTLTGDGEKEK
ncbi:hypothetical protein FGM00_00260 [Aggregatimonas sangjinii]|uniref:DUF748 domain-containing protein n=1 Tax=Aggregatimonas sangjinii TaxID=2583587 RepID=A0A5B7SNP2_9FLAO|nr:hypothetical protein [Aggregatimonas sangjinii]QCW98627.1 hypothetical protein FGM00_00260 [Aggregatimonas sangjinii]